MIDKPREVKAHFEAEGKRMNDYDLWKLANAEPQGSGGRRFEFTAEQRAAAELLTKKWQFVASEGAAVVLEPGRGDGGNMNVSAVTIPAPVGARTAMFLSNVASLG